MTFTRLTGLTLALLGAVAAASASTFAADAVRKRPLRPHELRSAISDILLVDVADLDFESLPQLPPVHRGEPIPPEYRRLAAQAAALVIDPRPERPLVHRWTVDFGHGGNKTEHPGVGAIEAGQRDGDDPWSAASFNRGVDVRQWSVAHAVCGGERGLPGVRVEGLKLPEAGTWRVRLRVARGRPPIGHQFDPCVLEIHGGRSRPLVSKELVGPPDRFELVEALVPVSADGRVDLTIGEATSLAKPATAAPVLFIDSLDIEGPIFDFAGWPPPSERRFLFPSPLAAYPDAYRDAVLTRFLERAFRRAPTADELTRFRAAGFDTDRPHQTLPPVIAAVLSDPAFLYLEDHTALRPGEVGRLTPHELTARLSFAVLGTTPPDDWLAATRSGEFPHLLDTHLADTRAWSLCERFADEWLRLDDLDQLPVDLQEYPAWPALRDDLRQEARAFLAGHYAAHKSRPRRLYDADRLFLNARLVRHYGLFGIEGSDFQPLAIKPAHGYSGVPTLGAVLALACDGRSDRVGKRGAYVWRLLFSTGAATASGAPEEIARLDELLAGYDVLGRWIGDPIGPRDTSALRKWLNDRERQFEIALAHRLGAYLIGSDLPPDDTGPSDVTEELRRNNFAPGDLQVLVSKWCRHPLMEKKW